MLSVYTLPLLEQDRAKKERKITKATEYKVS